MLCVSQTIKRRCASLLSVLAGAAVSVGLSACYGPPVATRPVNVHGTATAQTTGSPVNGIAVEAPGYARSTSTGTDGRYTMTLYLHNGEAVRLTATDPDGPANGGDFAGASAVATCSYSSASTAPTTPEMEVNFTLTPRP